jgi:hypothetical protein
MKSTCGRVKNIAGEIFYAYVNSWQGILHEKGKTNKF